MDIKKIFPRMHPFVIAVNQELMNQEVAKGSSQYYCSTFARLVEALIKYLKLTPPPPLASFHLSSVPDVLAL